MKKYMMAIVLTALLAGGGCRSKKAVQIDPTERGSDKKMYENAVKRMGRDGDKARLLFKEIMQLYPESVYASRSKLGIADSYFRDKDSASLIMAAAEYQEYASLYPYSPDAVYAKYQIGMCYYKQMKKPERDQTNTYATIKAFESLIQQYPDSPETEQGRKKIAEARQALAAHHFQIGYYNYQLYAFDGAITRFKQVIDEYPEFKKMDKLFYFAGKAYSRLNNYDSAISFFQRIIGSYPKSKYVGKSQKMITAINRVNKAKPAPSGGDAK
jgi:outer membrane protein assembly factor BamD